MRQQIVTALRPVVLAALLLSIATAGRAQYQANVSPAPDRATRDAGWHFGVGFGTVAWGSTSVCACAAVSLDVAVAYEHTDGFGLEYKPTLTNTVSTVVDQAVNVLYYPRIGTIGRPFGVYGGAGVVMPLEGFAGQRTGGSYGYGVRARAALGKRGRTRVFGDVGVVTFRQRFAIDQSWRDIVIRQRQIHSGLRVRVGVVW